LRNNKKITFPNNKQFVFTIIDDTDDAFLENIQPIYDFLSDKGLRTTKTVWVYPPRDSESKGDCLQRREYLDYILDLKQRGFEIALHNVGSGDFTRDEIVAGLEEFKSLIGEYPKIHINHSYNPDNIYSGEKRFFFPLRIILGIFYPQYVGRFFGEVEDSAHFWGDYHKRIIKYNRNYELDTLNIIKINSEMPYIDKAFSNFSNYWFSTVFAPNQWVFNHLVNKKSLDQLEKEGGVCILYTHFGYYLIDGKIDPEFVETIEYLSKKNGWYAPVSDVLDFLIENKLEKEKFASISQLKKMQLSMLHLWCRIKYRKIHKIDDYYFKKIYP
jgi:hypothetical protein